MFTLYLLALCYKPRQGMFIDLDKVLKTMIYDITPILVLGFNERSRNSGVPNWFSTLYYLVNEMDSQKNTTYHCSKGSWVHRGR